MTNQNKSGNGNSKDIRLIEQMMESVIRKRDHHYDKAKQLKTKSQIQEHKANAEAAILAISVEIFQSRTAAGGSIEGVDFAVTPYRLSKNLLAKVTGLLGPYLDVETMVG